jgi:acyl-CoA synthetase (AMP-forming)/AMP-acid ligase II
VEKVRDEEMQGVDLSSWEVALNGAEPVAPSVLRAFIGRFSKWGLAPQSLTPVYGLSEAALAVTFSDIDQPFGSRRFSRQALSSERRAVEDRAGIELASVGRPLPDFEIEVRDERGRCVADRRIGRIWVKGPSIMRGYLHRRLDTRRVLRHGWLDTGDLGFLLEGELFVTGRAKEVLIVRGQNHAPEELERAVQSVAGVRKGCCAAVSHKPDDREHEEVWLFVERARQVAVEEAEALVETCRREVLAHTGVAVDRVVVLEPGTLPRTSSGKIRRQEALVRYLGRDLRPPARVSPARLVAMWMRSTAAFLRWRSRQGDDGKAG